MQLVKAALRFADLLGKEIRVVIEAVWLWSSSLVTPAIVAQSSQYLELALSAVANPNTKVGNSSFGVISNYMNLLRVL